MKTRRSRYHGHRFPNELISHFWAYLDKFAAARAALDHCQKGYY
jgi:hypothetical protein